MTDAKNRTALIAVLIYAALWAGSVFYLFQSGGDWTSPLFIMGLFGLGLTGIAWLTTRGANAPPIPVERPALEGGAVLLYFALYVGVFLLWGLSALRELFPEGQMRELAIMAAK